MRVRTDSLGKTINSALRQQPSRVFVGRCEELHTLLDVATATPSVSLVEGEAGIGKTRLVRELLDQPAVTGRVVLVSSCRPIREPFPYGPVLELLGQAEDGCPPARDLSPVTGALRPYLPELDARLPASPEPLGDPRADRHQVFRGVRELLTALGPTVAVIEDLHWADDGSRDLLRFLADDLPPELALVLTYRREDLPAPGLPLGSAYRHPPGTASVLVSLAPLDAAAVREFAAATLGRSDVPPGLVSRLHHRTAGIPFVLEELCCALSKQDDGAATRTDGAALERIEVPLVLREAMADRLASLSAPAAEIVRAAAVLRMPSSEEAIAGVAGCEDHTRRAGIKQALQAGVLFEFEGPRYGFRHALAQQAMYGAIPDPERRELHGRAAHVLARLEPRPLVELAYHMRHAGKTQQWLRYSEEAADHAQAVGDNAIAVEVLGEALTDSTLPGALRGRLAVKLSRAALTGFAYRRVVSLLRGILRGGDLPDPIRGEVRLNLAVLLNNHAGGHESGPEEMRVAIEELRDRPALAARGMSTLALPVLDFTPLATHESWIEQAEQAASACDDPVTAMWVFGDRLTLMMSIGDPAVWRETARLPEHPGSVNEQHEVARAYANLAEGAVWLGHYGHAERFQAAGRRLAMDSQASGAIDSTWLRIDWARGHWQGLTERARQMLEITHDIPWAAGDARLVLGLLAITRGDWDEASEQLGAIDVSGSGNVGVPQLFAASGAIARLSAARGNTLAACQEVDRAVARMRRKGIWVWGGEFAPAAVEALVHGRRVDDAERFTADFAYGIDGHDAPLADAALEACRGILAAAAERHVESADAFERAREHYEQLPRPYSALCAGEAATRGRIAAGEESIASHLTWLADEFDALGASRDAARCRRALRERGVTAPSRRGRKGYGSRLSPRERDVARLVGLNRTNREIAEVLFLSPRTVEQHVAQVLRKLGVDSRSAVADVLGTGGD